MIAKDVMRERVGNAAALGLGSMAALLAAACSDGDGGSSTATGGAPPGPAATGGNGAGATGGQAGGDAASCTDTGATVGTPTLRCGDIGGICGDCIQEKCCELAEICTVDTDCACMASCVGTGSLAATNDCLTTCGLTGSPQGFADLAICLSTACANFGQGGECSVPVDYAPPPDVASATPTSDVGIGSGDLSDCGFGPADPTGSVVQLQSADDGVCVRMDLRNDGPGSLANTSWSLLSMRVGPVGEVVQIDDPAAICWYSSHHNFNDWAHAWSGSRRYEVKTSRLGHGATATYVLYVFEQGPLEGTCPPRSVGVCPIATIDLFPVP